MQLTIQNALYLILLTQAGFFGLFMLFQRQVFGIGIFFSSLAVHMALNLGYENNLLTDWPNLTFTLGLLYPPSLYFYFRELLNRDFHWSIGSFLHYVPWLSAVVFVLSGGNLHQWLPVIMPISIFGYLLAVFFQFYRFRRILGEQYSYDTKTAMRWCLVILLTYTLIIFFDLLRNFMQYFSPQSGPWMTPLLIVLLLILVNLMLIKRLTQPSIFKGISESDDVLMSKGSYGQVDKELSDEQGQTARLERKLLIEKLDHQMHETALFQEPGITVQHVADSLGVHSKTLSIAINQIKQKSFSEYIAGLRIDAVKARLRNTDEAISSIFYDLGFSSKASFNNTFKKLVGETPSRYRALHSTEK